MLRSGRRPHDRPVSAPERARRGVLQQQLHCQRDPEQRHRPVRRARRLQPPRAELDFRAVQLPEHEPCRTTRTPGPDRVRRLLQQHPHSRAEPGDGLVAHIRRLGLQRAAVRLQSRAL